MKTKFWLLFIASLLIFSIVFIPGTSPQSAEVQAEVKKDGKPFLYGKSLAEIEGVISKMSGAVMLHLAKKYGITEIRGKTLPQEESPGKEELISPMVFADRGVGTSDTISENEPSIAVKPSNGNTIVALSHQFPLAPIGAFSSTDRGETWAGPVLLPLLKSTDVASDPVVRWAPDSSQVYACYVSIRPGSPPPTSDVVVSRSSDNGQTWSKPVVAIPGGDYDSDGHLDFLDKPWLAVHTYPTGSAAIPRVYVTATVFCTGGTIRIAFARSNNFGASFSTPVILEISPGSTVEPKQVVQGSRPIGGRGRNVLVAWYDSGADGWGPGDGGGGVFDIKVTASTDFGKTFGPVCTAVDNMSYELPEFLGPIGTDCVGHVGVPKYHRWWGGMFPSIIITNDGAAHIVFTADPVPGSLDTEDGDIFYVRSPKPPYCTWSRPQRINDANDSRAQGYPTITAKRISGGSILFVAWEDHRLSVEDNELYDTFGNMNLRGWGPDFRITDVSSTSDLLFIGDYIDSSTSRVTSDRVAHVAFTDRSDETSPCNSDDDVYSDMIELQ